MPQDPQNDYQNCDINVQVRDDGLSFHWILGGEFANSFVSDGIVDEWNGELLRSESASDIVSARDCLRKAGTSVFENLFTDEVQRLWNAKLAGDKVRMAFSYKADVAATLARIPLEAMHCPANMSGQVEMIVGDAVQVRNVSIVRRVRRSPDLQQQSLLVELPLRVFIIASQPEDEQLEQVDTEVATLRAMLDKLGDAVDYQLLPPGEATFAGLKKLGPECHVIHFIGHGRLVNNESPGPRDTAPDAELQFEADDGGPDWRTGTEIAAALMQGQTRMFFLNGCQSAAAAVLACRFPAVVASLLNIYDDSALVFSEGLYRGLTDTAQLDDAVAAGREQIGNGLQALRWERAKPVLYMESESGMLILIRPSLVATDLPTGRFGVPYYAELEVRGGRRPCRFEVDQLPPGLHLDGRTGVISGTPEATGHFNPNVSLSSRDNQRSEARINLAILGGGGPTFAIATERIG